MTTSDNFEAEDKNFQLTNMAQLQRWLPWLRMFRSFRIAIDYQKMLPALLAVVLWGGGRFLIEKFFSGEASPLHTGIRGGSTILSLPLNKTPVSSEMSFIEGTYRLTDSNIWPVDVIGRSLLQLTQSGTSTIWWSAWLQLLWGLAISSVLGGMIARMAAREFHGHGRSMLREGKYGMKQAPAALGAPLIALVSFGCLWSMHWIAGFLGRIPVLGEIALALSWGCFLLISLIMFLLLLGLLLGWPLMLAAVAVEKSDSFDALSRSFSYLLNRPWYALFLAVIAMGYGTVTYLFIQFATAIVISGSLSSIGAGLGQEVAETPQLLALLQSSEGYFNNGIANWLLHFWIGLAILVPAAYTFSFLWTSSTIAYFLLRRREDGTPLHEMNLDDSQTSKRLDLAVVGIPAAELREDGLGASG